MKLNGAKINPNIKAQKPNIIIKGIIGATNILATKEKIGLEPKKYSITGKEKIWAENVVPKIWLSQLIFKTFLILLVKNRDAKTMPAVAVNDSQNPTSKIKNGFIINKIAAANNKNLLASGNRPRIWARIIPIPIIAERTAGAGDPIKNI